MGIYPSTKHKITENLFLLSLTLELCIYNYIYIHVGGFTPASPQNSYHKLCSNMNGLKTGHQVHVRIYMYI